MKNHDEGKCPTCGQRLPVVSIPSVWMEYDPPPTTMTFTSTTGKIVYFGPKGEVQ